MSPLRPRQLLHRGSVLCGGLVFDEALRGAAAARARALAAWTADAEVHRAGGRIIVLFAAARRLRCDQAPGVPLCRAGDVLSAAPLTADELRALCAPAGAVVLVRGGAAEVLTLSAATTEDPAGWLDTGDLAGAAVAPLGPEVVTVLPAEAPADVRRTLGAPLGAAQVEEVLAALRAAGAPVEVDVEGGGSAGQPAPGPARPGVVARALTALGRLLARWRGRREQRALLEAARRGMTAPRPVADPHEGATGRRRGEGAAPGPSWLQRLLERLERWATRAAARSVLGRLLGQRHGAYLGRLLRMLDDGDVEGALRHAIPLSGDKGLPAGALPLSLPTPRREIQISPKGDGGTAAIGLGPDLFGELKERYRRLAMRLEHGRRIEEAAFVLAELLDAAEEAVSLLERNGLLRQAATVAEVRRLAPGLVVRQWMLAGEATLAIDIARRTGAFVDAVLRLERQRDPQAEVLRVMWADHLADSGDFAGAVSALWPVEQGRRVARAWLERCIALGGAAGGGALAHKLVLVPEEFEAVRAALEPLLRDPEQAAARAAFAEVLCAGPSTPAVQVLGRAALRALLRDESAGEPIDAQLLAQLLSHCGDDALRADLPPPEPHPASPKAILVAIAAADRGTAAVRDAARVAGGRLLVALGEAGALLLGPDGRRIAHLDQPAHRLVVADHGGCALALAPRGELTRVARLDLGERRARFLFDVRVGAFAPDFDGAQWLVAEGDRVLLLDALAERPRALWQVPEVGGPVRLLARGPRGLAFLTASDGGAELWRYELPGPTLRARLRVPAGLDGRDGPEEPDQEQLALSGAGEVLLVRRTDAGELGLWLGPPFGRVGTVSPVLPEATVLGPAAGGGFAVVPCANEHAAVHVLETRRGAEWAVVRLGGARAPFVRLQPDVVLVGDERGRLVVLDLRRRSVRDLRI